MLKINFARQVWWRQDYFPFDLELYLKSLEKFRINLIIFKNDQKNLKLIQYFSKIFKQNYIYETITIENNIDFKKINEIEQIKIENFRLAFDYLFPNLFFTNFSIDLFDSNLAINLHKIIGKNLFKNPGEFRIRDAKPANEEYMYLNFEKIPDELKKLFEKIRTEFKKQTNNIDLIKLGVVFFINFLSIHPFENGNGRCARLLLSFLLINVTIVPLSIFNKQNGREIYLSCIREERSKSPNSDSILASLILECIFFNMEKACIFLDIYPN